MATDERLDVAQHISLRARLAFVADTEATYNVCIPDPLRMVLTEWPSQRPPPGSRWPDAVVAHATGKCVCRYSIADGELCQCATWVRDNAVDLMASLREKLQSQDLEPFDCRAKVGDGRWELFANPPRLHTDAQNEQTLRFIQMHPHHMWSNHVGGYWAKLSVRCLDLFMYRSRTHACGIGNGAFCLVLEGPARGEIHAWAGGWYQGFEARSYLDLRCEEWAEEDEEDLDEEKMGGESFEEEPPGAVTVVDV
ncbi:hypothetical protein FIBSPDRAFT_847809 [Athelia psychrophila]|uniref:Uncharacterized protein n=1 Tax=Athelia psychrophila TaxID=1759441 RepID=A0A166VZB7_9AGAM|nr:hypothetical protein FIBSPDRAFT_847809 [Fibularhizoctonia sp. CBS 109695]